MNFATGLRWLAAEENAERAVRSERMTPRGGMFEETSGPASVDDRIAAVHAHLGRMVDIQAKVTKLYEAGVRGGEAEKKALTDYYVADAERRLAVLQRGKRVGTAKPAVAGEPLGERAYSLPAALGAAPSGLLQLSAEVADTIELSPADLADRGLRVAEVVPAEISTLNVRGELSLDPERLVRVRPGFAGEIVEIGIVEQEGKPKRPLRFGDRVRKGQVLARLTCKDLGEKKSALVEALSRLHTASDILDRMQKAEPGAIAQRALLDAKRDHEQALVAVAKAQRTLASWGLSRDEISATSAEAEELWQTKPKEDAPSANDSPADPEVDKDWAALDIRAPIDGTIVEMNAAVGDVVGVGVDQFKIADLSVLALRLHVPEEDLPRVERLPKPFAATFRLPSNPGRNRSRPRSNGLVA